ncbi:MAG: hypothetical protein QOI38_626 [Sphingomonadales bacterium]|jgi:hypothetical protein|nr:hypothetical protein [Sphingomonadales bacterium]
MDSVNKGTGWHELPRLVSTYMMWIAVPLVLVGIVAVELGFSSWLPNDGALHLGLLVTLLFAVFQVMWAQHAEVSTKLDGTRDELRALRSSVRDDTALMKMEVAVLELETALSGVRPGEEIVIEHIGLDMTYAWHGVEGLIRRFRYSTRLDYRVLVLSDRAADAAAYHPDIRKWMSDGRSQIEFISRKKAELEATVNEAGGKLNLDVRDYSDLPVVHGIRVRRPFDVAYVAICRYGETGDYDWAGNSYHRLRSAAATPAQADLISLFERSFEHYWELGSPRNG